MSHLLVTRYSIKEDFGVEKGLKKLDDMEAKVKEITQKINKAEHDKKEEGKKEIEELKKKLGEEKDNYKEMLNGVKASLKVGNPAGIMKNSWKSTVDSA